MLIPDQYQCAFAAHDRLKEIIITLRTGKTVLSKVTDLILTIVGCIALNIDQNLCYHEYNDIFSEKSLHILKNDLENLLRFDEKFFDFFILELVTEAVKRERSVQVTSTRPLTIDHRQKRWNRVLLRRKIRVIVKFLIFRKTKRSMEVRVDNETMDWTPCKRHIEFLFRQRLDQPNEIEINAFSPNVRVDKFETRDRGYVNGRGCSRTMDVELNRDAKSSNFVEEPRGFHECAKYVCTGHSCNKIYWPLCYGLLWIPLYYCCVFLLPLVVNLTCQLAREIVLY